MRKTYTIFELVMKLERIELLMARNIKVPTFSEFHAGITMYTILVISHYDIEREMEMDSKMQVAAVICGSSKPALLCTVFEETRSEERSSLLRKESSFVIKLKHFLTIKEKMLVEGVVLGKCMFVWQLGCTAFL